MIRIEDLETYDNIKWDRTYNAFSGCDYALAKAGKIEPGMDVWGVSFSYKREWNGIQYKPARIMFHSVDEIVSQGDYFDVYFKAVHEDGAVLIQIIKDFQILQPVVAEEALCGVWRAIVPWHKPGVINFDGVTVEGQDQ